MDPLVNFAFNSAIAGIMACMWLWFCSDHGI
jgi:hypothetical protein